MTRRRDKDQFEPEPAKLDPSATQADGDANDTDLPRIASEADAPDDPFAPDGVGEADAGPSASRDLERQLADQRDKYLRLAAEYDNFRRRSSKERSEAQVRGQAELLKLLLDPLDDLARFAHVDPGKVDPSAVIQGAEMVEKKLQKVLAAMGLEPLNPTDQTFDPTVHEAVSTEPALSPEDDHVIAKVFQSGYLFNGQLLRPARVVVKQWNG